MITNSKFNVVDINRASQISSLLLTHPHLLTPLTLNASICSISVCTKLSRNGKGKQPWIWNRTSEGTLRSPTSAHREGFKHPYVSSCSTFTKILHNQSQVQKKLLLQSVVKPPKYARFNVLTVHRRITMIKLMEPNW